MAKRSRTSSRKTPSKRMRTWSRRSISKGAIQNRVHRFRRNLGLTTITGAGTSVLGGASYTLSQLPSYSEFSALFDQYKITHIKVRFQLTTDPAGPAAPSTGFCPRIWTVVDRNSDGAPASVDELRQYGNVAARYLTPYKPVIVNIKPTVSTETYSNTAALMRVSPWINSVNAGVYHYGLKYAIDNLPTGYKVETEVTMWLSTKNVV